MGSRTAAVRSGSWPMVRAWLGLAALGALLDATTPLLMTNGRSQLAVHNGLQVLAAGAAAVACLLAAQRIAGRARTGWALLGVGSMAWAVGQAIWTWDEVVLGHVPLVGPQDVAYLALYPLATAGLLLLTPLGGRGWAARTSLVLDGVVSVLAIGVLAWPIVLHHAFHDVGGGIGAVVTVAYPLGDILLLGLVGGILMRERHAWRSALGLAYAAFALIFFADLGYVTGIFQGTYATGRLSDAGWIAGFFVLAAAANAPLPPSSPSAAGQGYARAVGRTLPLVAVLMGMLAFLLGQRQGESTGPWQAALGLLFVAALARQSLAGLELLAIERDKQSTEKQYRDMIEQSPAGIFRASATGTILLANPAFAKMTGYESPDALREAAARGERLYADPTDQARLAALLVRDELVRNFDFRIRRPDGELRWLRLDGHMSLDDDGQALFGGFVQDITEERQVERAREDLESKNREVSRLEELNRMRMDFLNTAAHDLKTPLTPLRLQMAALRFRGSLDPTQKSSLDIMERNINRFQVLVEDMLDAARLQAGKLKLRRERVALANLVGEATASFQEPARLGKVTVEVAPPPQLFIDADPAKAMQVLMNLVSNAVKYTSAGGRVDVRVESRDKEAVLAITDSGLGMTSEQIARLFQPFVRLHEGMEGVAKGTGLGLYISKGIIEQHGGRLWAESPGPGKGSTFYAAWPLAGPAAPQANDSSPPAPA